ncbi:MAG: SRPBCC family protein [Chloroflexi bacterium]|nr:MAG: SRPBCC family protein [Chloroflexota bacterium]
MADTQGLTEHGAAVDVNAPVHQVYALFTHFNDFPKFMSFVKEVTYYDDQRSHWVAEIVGRHEWDAINEDWVEDRQVGWRSINGFENTGRVTFEPLGPDKTRVNVLIRYNPPAGVLGDVGEKLGAGSRFENALQHDLDNFARMVDQAPPGALDPTSSNYLFHSGSAAAKGTTTSRQDETMGDRTSTADNTTGTDRMATVDDTIGADRPVLDQDIISGQYDNRPTPER